jgi:acyl-CoA thioester hydrolase
MEQFIQTAEIRWSDLDPNFHLRHSVYYDYGAFARINFLNMHELTPEFMNEYQFGPILFREECVFRKEIRLGDTISLDVRLLRSRTDFSRWSIRHNIFKNTDVLAAVLTVDGAWIDLQRRKLATPPEKVAHVFEQMPRTEDFEWIK